MPSVWLTNGDSSFARIWRSLPPSQRPSVSPPTMMSRPARRQGAAEVRQPAVAADVEDHVVAVLARDVVDGVVEDVVGARACGPARPCRRCTRRSPRPRRPWRSAPRRCRRRLRRRGSAPSRRPGPAPWSRTACSAVSAEIGTAAACSKERFAGLRRELARLGASVLGERALARAVDLVAGREGGHLRADGLDGSCHAAPRVRGLGRAEPEARDADRVGQAGHHVPRAAIHAGRVHPDEDLVVADRGLGDLGEPEHVLGCGAVFVLDDGCIGLCDGRSSEVRRAVVKNSGRACRLTA